MNRIGCISVDDSSNCNQMPGHQSQCELYKNKTIMMKDIPHLKCCHKVRVLDYMIIADFARTKFRFGDLRHNFLMVKQHLLKHHYKFNIIYQGP